MNELSYCIFRGNRGEGKTKWLCEQLMKYLDEGFKDNQINFVYVGTMPSFLAFKDAFSRMYGMPCPIKHYTDKRSHYQEIYFTDEVTYEMPYFDCNHTPKSGIWYMTIDNEVFI